MMYEHRYKHGKQKGIMKLADFQQRLEASHASLEQKAYAILLWHTGVRKSEAYERIIDDVVIEPGVIVIDFHKRKKGGEEVPPLKIPRDFYGIEEYLVPWVTQALTLKSSRKRLFYQVETLDSRTTKKGKVVSVKNRISKTEKAAWLFPNIASTSAWTTVKALLGDEFYPHYLRLRKLSAIGKNPKTRSLIHIKAVSGLKSLRAIESYLGFDEETQDEAMMGSE
jgi:integrase